MSAGGHWGGCQLSTKLDRQPEHLPAASLHGLVFLTTWWPLDKGEHIYIERERESGESHVAFRRWGWMLSSPTSATFFSPRL